MGREVRFVPPNWQHPVDDRGRLRPMHHCPFVKRFEQWLEDFDRVRRGELSEIEIECYVGDGKNPLAEWLKDEGAPPDPAYYAPWDPKDATWFSVWETVSEGTPVTPAFATAAELVDYLVEGGDDWDRKHGRGGYARAQAEAFVSAGWAPSFMMMVSSSGSVVANSYETPLALANAKKED